MNLALPHASVDDPRIPAIVSASLRRARLEREWEPTISRLMTGEMSPQSLHCCGSGCRPCVQELLRCTASALRAYHDPAIEAELLAERRPRHAARRLAGRIANRALRRVRFPGK